MAALSHTQTMTQSFQTVRFKTTRTGHYYHPASALLKYSSVHSFMVSN